MKRFTLAALCAATLICPLVISVGKASAGEVLKREDHQQLRIYHGVAARSIQPHEFRILENREDALNAARLNDLKKDDGFLNQQSYRRLNQRENHISQSIHNDKHN